MATSKGFGGEDSEKTRTRGVGLDKPAGKPADKPKEEPK
jgi:hypothetical protein